MCFIAVFGMLLGDTLILDDLDCANRYRQEVMNSDDAVSQLSRGILLVMCCFVGCEVHSLSYNSDTERRPHQE